MRVALRTPPGRLISRLGQGMILVNVLVILFGGYAMYQGRLRHRARAAVDAGNASQAVARTLSAVIDRADLALQFAGHEIQQQAATGHPSGPYLDDFLTRQRTKQPHVVVLGALDGRGELQYVSDRAALARGLTTARGSFVSLRDNARLVSLLSPPRQDERTGARTVTLARRVTTSAGRFDGVVFAAISLDQLSATIFAKDSGRHRVVTVWNGRHQRIAKNAPQGRDADSSGAQLFAALQEQPSGGSYTERRDGQPTLLHAFTAPSSHGLVVDVGLAEADYLAGWWWQSLLVLCFIGVFAALSVVFVVGTTRGLASLELSEARVRRLSYLHAALRCCTKISVRCGDEEELFLEICRVVVEFGGMKMAWVGRIDQASARLQRVVAFGEGLAFLDDDTVSFDDQQPTGRRPGSVAAREGSPVWCQDFVADLATAPRQAAARREGLLSMAALPLVRGGTVVAVFSVCAGARYAFDAGARDLLLEIASDVGNALNRIAARAGRLQADAALVASRAQHEIAARMAKVGAWSIDGSLRHLVWSTQLCRIYDAGPDYEPSIKHKLTFFDPESRDRVQRAVDVCVRDGEAFDLQVLCRSVTGRRFAGRMMGEATRDATGQICGVHGALQDVDERSKRHQAQLAQQAHYHQLFQSLPMGFALHQAIYDEHRAPIDYKLLAVNRAFSDLVGCPASDLIGRTALDVLPNLDPMWITRCAEVTKTGVAVQFEQEAAAHDRTFDVLAYAPEPDQLVTLISEITARKKMEESLRTLSVAVEQSPNALVITDVDANIVYVNETQVRHSGYSAEELMGCNPRVLSAGQMSRAIYADMWAHMTSGRVWRGEFVNRHKDGALYVEAVTMAAIVGDDDQVTGYLSIKQDITEMKRAQERIVYLANFDQLTGLPNRSQLQDHVKIALGLADRRDELAAVLFLDLDHFKTINDTLGHSVGDLLLVKIARRFTDALRDTDTVARLGGDEFVFLLRGTDAAGAAQVAGRLLSDVAEPLDIDGHELAMTASIGVAVYPGDGRDMETLAKNADTAMYRAKHAGRNQVCFYTQAMQAGATRSLELATALRHAMDRGELSLHYQPQIAMDDGRIVGAEALLRWHHPKLGSVSPGEFIPVAEETGMIIRIGEWVLREAATQAQRWREAGLPAMVIAVNVSAVQFRHANLAQMVTDILAETGLPPAGLEIELTEAAAMHNPTAAVAVMDALHGLGVRMAIDDFGTGYSSLSYLKRFKVYKLKIDQSFVRDISDDSDDKVIVTAIIQMAANLGMQTIAEGVETADQLAFLRTQGCDEVQGYYFSRPLPVPQFEDFVRDHA